jgi:hypothetical protein
LGFPTGRWKTINTVPHQCSWIATMILKYNTKIFITWTVTMSIKISVYLGILCTTQDETVMMYLFSWCALFTLSMLLMFLWLMS